MLSMGRGFCIVELCYALSWGCGLECVSESTCKQSSVLMQLKPLHRIHVLWVIVTVANMLEGAFKE